MKVAVETIRVGDSVFVPKRGPCIVSKVHHYADEGVYVVVYFAHDEDTYENKARDRGGERMWTRIVEKQLVPMRAGELFEVERGAPLLAEPVREAMNLQFAARTNAVEKRYDRLSEGSS